MKDCARVGDTLDVAKQHNSSGSSKMDDDDDDDESRMVNYLSEVKKFSVGQTLTRISFLHANEFISSLCGGVGDIFLDFSIRQSSK